MTGKAEFNAEEWSTILQGPPIAGMVVITSERGGTLRESVSMARAYAEARQQHGESELLDEILSSQPEFDPTRFRDPGALREGGLQQLRQAVTLLREKATPEEVESYGRFVQTLAEKVASAHKEGGVLGVGGKPVSASEQAALDEIQSALANDQP